MNAYQRIMSFSKKKIILDSLVYTLLPKLSFIASLLVLPWISPYLSLEDYGIYGILISYITLLQIFVGLGQNVILQNSFFTHGNHYKLIWRRSYAIMIFGGVVSTLVFAALLFFTLSQKLGANAWPIFFMTSVYFMLTPIDTIIINYYTLKEKSFAYAYGAALNGVITTLVTILTIRYLKLGYMGWMISLPVVAIINHLYFGKRIYIKERLIPQFKFKKTFFKKAMKIGLPLTPHGLSLYILGISDRLLLEYFKIPIARIGFYSQGYNMGSQGSIFVNGLFQALNRRLQEGFRGTEEKDRIFIKKTIIIIPALIGIILCFGGLWMKEIFLILFRKPELQQAYPVAIIVLCSYMFWSLYAFFVYPLSIKNKTFSQAKISILAAIFNIVGNIIFIPFYGIWAAVGVTYVSYIIFGFAGLLDKENRIFFNRYVNIVKVSIYFLIINVLLFTLAYCGKDFSIIIKGLITIVFASGISFLYKTNSKIFS